MVRRGDDVVVLWPRYFDEKVSRQAGRRVSTDLAVRKPDAAWIESAAEKAGFKATAELDARDPATPWNKSGRVVIEGKGDKEATIRAVAEKMSDGN